ncbi:MAG: ketol-acid reductoisomerase [Methanomassiliicoccales archaeon PtaU1.Bin030]|nr:MAG: ketol-acid reductoisomerase [Methanomassiliicoccales archaeon PtaU1.Bin030]
MATKIYHDSDADLEVLNGKKIAVIGYGNQGRAQALCIHDCGMNVTVGARKGGESWDLAQADGLKVADIPSAVKGADIVMILLPDEVQPRVYKEQIAPNLKDGASLEFAHGFAITFKLITPPKNADVIMVAPKSPGRMVRQTFLEGFGVPSLIAVEQDASGKAKKTALALAKCLGSTKAGVLETDFREEATSDLFGEQAVLCGGVTALIEAGFETLINAGYKPEIAYFEVLHELKLIVDLIQAGGMMHMWDSVSNTAEYGGLTRRDRVINEESKNAMKKILEDINSGRFAEEWTKEWTVDLKNMKRLEAEESEKEIERVGKEIRRLFERKN